MSKVLKSALPKLSSPRKAPFTVFIEGNIGAGKTTFLNHFKKYDDVRLYTEPVEKWRNVDGFNLLVNISHWILKSILFRSICIFGAKNDALSNLVKIWFFSFKKSLKYCF